MADASDVTANRLPDWVNEKPDAQRAAYVALRRKGWTVMRSTISGVQALKDGNIVYAPDFILLLNKAAAKDKL